MSLTPERIRELRAKIGIDTGGVSGGVKVSAQDRIASLRSKSLGTEGNQFDMDKPETREERITENVRKGTATIFGGGKLAEGLGKAIAAPGVQKTISKEQEETVTLQKALLNRIREKKTKGEDTSRLEKALRGSQDLATILNDVQSDFAESLPTDKEVIGSSLRLMASAAASRVAKGASKLLAKPVTSVGSGIIQGAKTGTATGFVEGGIHGFGAGLEEDKSIKESLKQGTKGAGVGVVAGGVLGGVVGGVAVKIKNWREAKKLTEELIKNNPDSRVAKYKLSGEGKVVKDKVAKEAIKQGMDEGVAATVKGSSSKDKVKMNKMLDIFEKGRTDPKYAAVNRSSDVLGDSVMERFKVVSTANKKAASQLDDIAKGLSGSKVDAANPVNSFMDDLDNLGVTFKNGEPVYTGSQIEGLREPQQIINRVIKRMTEVSDDAYEIHKLKKFIDEQVTFGKTSGGLTGKAETILKSLRRNLDTVLDTTFTDYNNVNSVYSTTKEAIDDFIGSAGAKFDPTDINASKRVGTLMRRILSNAQSRISVLNAMQKLQTVAEANGGKFSDDIITQTVFVNDLERMFGTQAPTSLAGEVTKGVQKASGILGKMKSSQGVGDIALQLGAEGIEKIRNINPEGAIKALRALLK